MEDLKRSDICEISKKDYILQIYEVDYSSLSD